MSMQYVVQCLAHHLQDALLWIRNSMKFIVRHKSRERKEFSSLASCLSCKEAKAARVHELRSCSCRAPVDLLGITQSRSSLGLWISKWSVWVSLSLKASCAHLAMKIKFDLLDFFCEGKGAGIWLQNSCRSFPAALRPNQGQGAWKTLTLPGLVSGSLETESFQADISSNGKNIYFKKRTCLQVQHASTFLSLRVSSAIPTWWLTSRY